MKTFLHKNILITGAGSGIGRKLALRLAEEKPVLILTDVNQEGLEETCEMAKKNASNVYLCKINVTDFEAIKELHSKLQEMEINIDMLINNAGVVFGGSLLNVPFEKHELTFKVNSIAPVAMTYVFLPDLIKSRDSHLVNIASASGLIGLPNGSTYSASKWAAIGFSESIRLELKYAGHSNIKVTTVCPSYVSTGMFNGVNAPLFTPIMTPDKLVEKIISGIKKGTEIILEPAMVKTIPFLKAFLPSPVLDVVSDLFGVTSGMKGWKGR